MPQASSSPNKTSPRRYHPASQSSRPRRPVHPPPDPPLPPSHETANQQEMATTSSSIRPPTYWNPGPYTQPGRSNSVPNIPAPPPHVLPSGVVVPPGFALSKPLPQRPTPDPNQSNMDSLADAAMVRSRYTERQKLPPPTVTKINFSDPPPAPGGMPQWPPGSVREPINMSFTAPHQIRRAVYPPMIRTDPEEVTKWGPIEQFKNAPPPSRKRAADETPFDPRRPSPPRVQVVKPKKRQFGEMPNYDGPLADGPLARLTLSRPTSPSASRPDDWHEVSRRLMHPRSIYSPPSPPRRQLPKIREDAVTRRNRSSENSSNSNSRESPNETPSKPDSQPESQTETSQTQQLASQPMIATQGSNDSGPSLFANDSTTTFRSNSTQDSIIASPMLPPRPAIGRSLSFQPPRIDALLAPANTLELDTSDETSTGMKRRRSEDGGPSKRERS